MCSRGTPHADYNCIIRYGLRERPNLVSAPPSVPIEANKASRSVVTTHVFGSVASGSPPTRRGDCQRDRCLLYGERASLGGRWCQTSDAGSSRKFRPHWIAPDTYTRNPALMKYGSWKSRVHGNWRPAGRVAALSTARGVPPLMVVWRQAGPELPPDVGMSAAGERKKMVGIVLLFASCDVLIGVNHTHEGAP